MPVTPRVTNAHRLPLLSTCCEWRPFWSHLTGSMMSGSRIITTIAAYHKTTGRCQLLSPLTT